MACGHETALLDDMAEAMMNTEANFVCSVASTVKSIAKFRILKVLKAHLAPQSHYFATERVQMVTLMGWAQKFFIDHTIIKVPYLSRNTQQIIVIRIIDDLKDRLILYTKQVDVAGFASKIS